MVLGRNCCSWPDQNPIFNTGRLRTSMQLLTILLAIALWTTGVIASTSKRYQTVQPNLNCWGTNVSACQDPIVGSNGAVVTVTQGCKSLR